VIGTLIFGGSAADGRDGLERPGGPAPQRCRPPGEGLRRARCGLLALFQEREANLCASGRGRDMPPPCRLRRDAGVGPGRQRDQGESGTAAAAGGGARSWVARRAEAPRWSRMRRMTRLSVMKATTRITPRQRGQTSGSVS